MRESREPISVLLRPNLSKKRMKTEPKKISWEKMVMLVSAAMLQGKPRSFSTFVGSMGVGSVWVGDAVVIMAPLVDT